MSTSDRCCATCAERPRCPGLLDMLTAATTRAARVGALLASCPRWADGTSCAVPNQRNDAPGGPATDATPGASEGQGTQ